MSRKAAGSQPFSLRNLKTDRQPIRCGNHDAHVCARPAPPLAWAGQMPAAMHAQMSAKAEVLTERDEDMFASRFDRRDLAAGQSTSDRQRKQLRQSCFEGGHLGSSQRAMQSAGCTEYRIALRHA